MNDSLPSGIRAVVSTWRCPYCDEGDALYFNVGGDGSDVDPYLLLSFCGRCERVAGIDHDVGEVRRYAELLDAEQVLDRLDETEMSSN